MTFTPNRIVLISHGRYDEAISTADMYPGMVLQNSGTTYPLGVAPSTVEGGIGPLMIAIEDALQGGDITQKIPSGSNVPYYRPSRGDLFLMLLQNGQNVAANVPLMSAGDGTLIAAQGAPLYEIVAPSTVITNLGTETAFSNGSFILPANSLQVGDVLRVRTKVFCIAENSTNTHRIRLYIGAGPTTLVDSTALQLAANDIVIFDVYLTIRTITASGTFIADGLLEYSVSGTFTTTPFTVASTTIDTTLAQTLVIKSLASATNAGNQVRLDEMRVDLIRTTGLNALVWSAEAINNSSGTGTSPVSGFNSAAFLRCQVP